MICYEVFINGKKKCVAGVGEQGVLTGILTWVKRKRHEADQGCKEGSTHVEELFITVGGLVDHGKDSVHLDWLRRSLTVGDEVRFRIVQREISDPPKDARTNVAEVVERERREYYEQMKKEYGDEGTKRLRKRSKVRGPRRKNV
jgi:hypothetical protein